MDAHHNLSVNTAMNRLYPSDLAAFQRKYRFAGGRLRRLRVRQDGEQITIDIGLTVRTLIKDLGSEPRTVRLRLRLVGVEEYRFQKRPTATAGKVSDARIGYFGDIYYVNLDAWGLGAGEVPKLHDFRASDSYIGGRELWWEEIEAKK